MPNNNRFDYQGPVRVNVANNKKKNELADRMKARGPAGDKPAGPVKGPPGPPRRLVREQPEPARSSPPRPAAKPSRPAASTRASTRPATPPRPAAKPERVSTAGGGVNRPKPKKNRSWRGWGSSSSRA